MVAVITFIFVLFPLLSLPLILIGLLIDEKHRMWYGFLFAIWIGILLYHQIPDTDMDLYRYFKIMDSYKYMDLKSILNIAISNPEPISTLLLYIFSLTGKYSLLTVFVCIVSYLIIFYIFCDYTKDKKLSKIERNTIIIYELCTFLIMYNIGGIRFCLARLIFLFIYYLEAIKNKNKLLLVLYIIPPLIHSSTIFLVMIRIVLLITKGRINKVGYILMIIIALLPNLLLSFVSRISEISLFSTFSERADIYLSGHYSNLSNIYLLQLALLIFLIFTNLYIKFKKVKVNKYLINYSNIVLIVPILFINISSIATRFILIATTNSYMVIQDVVMNLKKKNKAIYLTLLLIFSTLYFSYQVISLKDVSGYGTLFNDSLTNSLFTIFN